MNFIAGGMPNPGKIVILQRFHGVEGIFLVGKMLPLSIRFCTCRGSIFERGLGKVQWFQRDRPWYKGLYPRYNVLYLVRWCLGVDILTGGWVHALLVP
jgi:hypothetical protein